MTSPRILVLGSTGMLGNALLRYFCSRPDYKVFGTARTSQAVSYFSKALQDRIIVNVDVTNTDHLLKLFADLRPNIVLNCVGIVKQLSDSCDPLAAVPINSLLPHRLASLCASSGARLIHFSTDCVFSGSKGSYKESDITDSLDLYGLSKLIGEVDLPHVITLRTSLIGHELAGSRSLVNWFLSQSGSVTGFRRAIFSGLPTVEIARIVEHYVLPNHQLHGLYHLSANPITKYDLLCLISDIYKKNIEIIPDDKFVVDRSLDSSLFRNKTGFSPTPWPELVLAMRNFS